MTLNKTEVTILAVLAVVTLASFDYVNRYEQMRDKAELVAMIENNAAGRMQLAERSKFGSCQVRGPLPDPECTPGGIFPEATREIICVKGYTKTVRSVSTGLKKRIYESYGFTYPQEKGAFEADHLIPLELGGNNDISNLFPESAEPRPGYHEKDIVENYLNHEMCAGNISLAAAQLQIARDWFSVYNRLSSQQIRELQQEYSY